MRFAMRICQFTLLPLLTASLLVPGSAQSSEDLKSSTVPLLQGLAALQKSQFEDADRWWGLTVKDFPNHVDGVRALTLQIAYRVARELAYVRMGHHLLEGSKMELKDKGRWRQRIDEYETAALKWGEALYERSELMVRLDGEPSMAAAPLPLEVSLDTQKIAVGKLQERLKKGEMLEDESMRELEHAEWLRNFIGTLGEFLGTPDSQLLEGSYSGVVNRVVLYRTVGVRLFILWERNHQERFAQLAKKYFERVIALTQDQPYNVDRQKAQDFLGRLQITQTKETQSNAKGKKRQ